MKPFDLRKALDQAVSSYNRQCERILRQQEIHEFLRNNVKVLNSRLHCSHEYYWDGYIYVSLKDLEIEDAISLLSPIWHKFQKPWRMKVESNGTVELRVTISSIDLVFDVHPPLDGESCRVVKVPKRILTEREVDEIRVEYEYKMDCSDKEE